MRFRSLLAFLLASIITCSNAATITGYVVAVTDGDTVKVLDRTDTQHKIRLAGIDAPEKKQPYGQRSKQSLSDLVYGKLVNVEIGKTDKYGREIGKILIDGKDANLEQVTRGFAWHYKEFQKEQSDNDRMLYDFAEKEARAARRGLWADADSMPPWDFRHKGK